MKRTSVSICDSWRRPARFQPTQRSENVPRSDHRRRRSIVTAGPRQGNLYTSVSGPSRLRTKRAGRFQRVKARSGPMADPPGGEPAAYQPQVAAQSSYLTIRGLRYHLREWRTGTQDTAGAAAVGGSASAASSADSSAPLLVMLHGWMDVSASFQFVVDALERRWRVVAPDWRGFGLSEGAPGREWSGDGYAFADYFGDLEALLEQLSPDAPVRLVAHSMGGNIAMLYAGMRPGRVAGLVNLEGFGMPATDPAKAVERYRRWLDELREPVRLRPYATLEDVAARLMRNNPRLPRAKAQFLAAHWARPLRPGEPTVSGQTEADAPSGYVLRADPAHKRVNP